MSPDMETLRAEHKAMASALRTIAGWGGNLPDERLESRTGANDAVHRGMMYTACREIANKTLETLS